MDCFQPIPKQELSETIIEVAAKYFGIDDDNEKCNLGLFFEFYASAKTKENIVKAFQKPKSSNN